MGERINRLTGWHISLLIALVALVFVGLIGLGNTGQKTAAGPRELSQKPAAVRKGYVRIPALMAEHPLYDSLVEIDREIAELQRVGIEGFPSLWDRPRPGYIAYSLPNVPSFTSREFDLECTTWQSTREGWRRERSKRLAPDLRSRLRFKERTIKRRLNEDLSAKEAEAELKIARKRRDIAARYQEALINSKIALDTPTEGEQGGPTLEQKLRENMQKELEKFRHRVRQQLERNRKERKKRAERQLQAAREQIRQEQAQRAESSVSSGGEIASRLSKELQTPDIADYSDRVVGWEPGSFSIYAPDRQLGEPDFQKLYGAAASRAQKALSARRERTLRALHRETVSAVRVAAMDMGVDVVIKPDRADEMPDLTGKFRTYLQQLWGK